MLAAGLADACAATGDLLLRYESSLGTLPSQQGWVCDTNCLKDNCPAHAIPPLPGQASECWFQGGQASANLEGQVYANDCTIGHGCGPDASGSSRAEHYNAPAEPLGEGAVGACSCTEWLAFDDGEDFLDSPFPVALPHRNLTFGPGDPVTSWGPHAHPAFGAPGFVNAPVYAPLRIVTGGGVPGVNTLPASKGNNRNIGKIQIRRSYTPGPGATAVTLVAKMACGNRFPQYEMIQIGGVGRRFALGVDGVDGSPTLGQFRAGTTTGSDHGPMFDTRTVQVALARQNVPGPHHGEFFTVRLILQSNGSVEAWLNDDPTSHWTGIAVTSSGNNVLINPDQQAGTMWVDYVRLFEGPVPPVCGDPVFDVNHDGKVNGTDSLNGADGFLDCVTGPGAPAGIYDALSDRCKCHDVNKDRQIDMVDFAVFQRCLSLGSTSANPACDDRR